MTDFNKNIDLLTDVNGNLRSDVIKDYIHGTLTSKQMYAVERHLLNSPFDAEVVEGYQSMRKNKNPDYYVEQVKMKIPEIVGPEKSMQINTKLIAASVVGLLGLVSVGYLISSIDFSSKKADMAVTTPAEVKKERVITPLPAIMPETDSTQQEEASTPLIQPEETVATDLKKEKQQEQSAEKKDEKPLVKEPKQPEQPVVMASSLATTASDTELKPTDEKKEDNQEMQALNDLINQNFEQAKKVQTDPAPDMLAFSKQGVELPKVSKKHEANAEKNGFTDIDELRTPKSLLDEAGVRFKKKQYAEAAKFYDLALSSSPNDQDALTYGGLSNLYIGNYAKSASQLSQVAKKSDHVKWSLATAYLKVGRKESAKTILNDLKNNSTSAYKTQAEEVLKEWE